MNWKDLFGVGGSGPVVSERPDYNVCGYASATTMAEMAAKSAERTNQFRSAVYGNQMTAQYAAAMNIPRKAFGHTEEQLKGARTVHEYFYIEQSDAVPDRTLLPLYHIRSFRVGLGVEINANQPSQLATFPAEMYGSREEAEQGVTVKLREHVRKLVEQLALDMTNASLGMGLLDDASLDLTDALRKYLDAVEP